MRYYYVPASYAAHAVELAGPPPAAAPAHRALVPMRELTAAEWARVPDVNALAAKMEAAGAVHLGTTYAMAEEIATATLIESVALRFTLADGRRGVVLWWDWRWHGAIVRELGVLTRERLELLIATGSAEIPLFVCERCGAERLRRNKDGSLRAHRRAREPGRGEACK